MSSVLDQKLGSAAEIKIDQVAATTVMELDFDQPISIKGIVVGKVSLSPKVEIDELALLELIAGKYPWLQSLIDKLKTQLAPKA